MNIFGLSKQPDPVFNFDFIDPNPNDCDDDDCSESLFTDDYFAQDDEYTSLVNSRDDEDFNFDDFDLDNLEPEEDDYSGLDDFFEAFESE